MQLLLSTDQPSQQNTNKVWSTLYQPVRDSKIQVPYTTPTLFTEENFCGLQLLKTLFIHEQKDKFKEVRNQLLKQKSNLILQFWIFRYWAEPAKILLYFSTPCCSIGILVAGHSEKLKLPLITGTPSLSETTIAWRPSTLQKNGRKDTILKAE